ncbi:MAG: glycosyltransferase family 4 protein, partial [Rhodoferax sp.]|nr:glycosyltransferase family 4 protein [Rhodoferax sp.]
RVHCVYPQNPGRNYRTELWNTQVARAFGQFLQGFEVADSVVHIHSLAMGQTPAIAGPLRNKKIRFIITAHDAGWACPTGCFYNFQTHRYCPLQPMSPACLLTHCDKRTPLHKAYKVVKMVVLDQVSRLKRDAAAILVPSETLRQRLLGRVPAGTPLITLQNPVNAVQQDLPVQPGKAFLYVGRLFEEKGIAEMLQTIASHYPVVVIGNGPLQQRMAARYPQVVFKGWLPPEQVAAEMRQAIAVVLPTVSMEAFGLVVAEALAQGVPVIVSKRAGASSMVEPGFNGFVVDMDAPEQLLQSCRQLMDTRQAARMAHNAHSRYWTNPLSTQAYTEGLMRVLEGIPAIQSGEQPFRE